MIGDPYAGTSQPDKYWNAAAFDFPRDAQGNRIRVVGNAGRNTFQQPGLNNWDMGLMKNFRITERFNSQFRWEMFNTLEPYAVRQREHEHDRVRRSAPSPARGLRPGACSWV